MSDPTRKTPNANWILMSIEPQFTRWTNGTFMALSSLCNIDDGHQPIHQEWVLSFSRMGKARCNNADIQTCLRDFDALDFEEDNHEPNGIARKFWMPVEYKYRTKCPCKDEVMGSQDDYVYSVPKTSEGIA